MTTTTILALMFVASLSLNALQAWRIVYLEHVKDRQRTTNNCLARHVTSLSERQY